MDLVEIREKAKRGRRQAPTATKAEPPVEKAKVTPQGPAVVTPAVPPAAKEVDLEARPVSAQPEPEELSPPVLSRSALEALDELFAGAADIDLATEEIYLQGLQDQDAAANIEKQQWLTFGLGGEHYAVDIRYVRELIKPREITDIPRVPDFILGIISLRGIIVPIFDLRRRLKLEAAEIDLNTRIVVCEQGDRVAGLLVDNITQVVKFSEQEIEPPPAVLSGLDRELVEGVGRVQGKMVVLLDLPSVLDAELN